MKTVVIARYNEDLGWISKLPAGFNIVVIQKEVDLPNIGRESLSYLFYIVNNYANLDGWYFFMQGNPHSYHDDIVDFTVMEAPYFFGPKLTSDCDGAPTHNGLDMDGFAMEAGLPVVFPLNFCAGAQFLVTADQIKAHPLDLYKNLMDMHYTWKDAPWIMERLWQSVFKPV